MIGFPLAVSGSYCCNHGFCREQCRRKYQASWERKKLLRRLIFRPPSVWLETGNASTRSNLSASSPAGKLPLQQ